jgi:hypothetical protein
MHNHWEGIVICGGPGVLERMYNFAGSICIRYTVRLVSRGGLCIA